MEILFENSYVRNKELAKELYRYFYFQRKWLVVCYVLIFLSFFVNILISIFDKTYNWSILIFTPLFFLFQLYCYFHQVSRMIKRDYEVHHKEISVDTIVTNDYIQSVSSAGGVIKLEYNNIKYVVQTKNLILLRTKANLLSIFRKDTFKKGTKEDFISFLISKGIKVK